MPNISRITIYSNCPFDLDYSKVCDFRSGDGSSTSGDIEEPRNRFFASLPSRSYENLQYIRSADGSNSVRVPDAFDNVSAANYCKIVNDAGTFHERTVYAFIVGCKYYNAATTELVFITDYFQTYLGKWEFLQSFVEREHSETDEIGENILPEPVELGPEKFYIGVAQPKKSAFLPDGGVGTLDNNLSCLISYVRGLIDWPSALDCYKLAGGVYSGVWQGINFILIPDVGGNFNLLNSVLQSTSRWDGTFINAVMVPSLPFFKTLVPQAGEPATPVLAKDYDNEKIDFYLDRPEDLDGYIPRNKKLFTYPYISADLSTPTSIKSDLKYEFSADPYKKGRIYFALEANFSPTPSIMCYPENYNGRATPLDLSVSMVSTPQCSWPDVEAWQQNVSNALFSTAVMGVGMLATGPAAAAIPTASSTAVGFPMISGAAAASATSSAVANPLAAQVAGQNITKALHTNREARGSGVTSATWGNAVGRRIEARAKGITKDYAKRIDDFFTMYGYSCQQLKIPKLYTRPGFNYLKITNCNIRVKKASSAFYTDGMSATALKAIKAIFTRGVTVWHDGKNVGDYSVENSPVKV